MERSKAAILLWAVVAGCFLAPAVAAEDSAAWPALTSQSRPWVYWHVMGSAFTETELRRHLEMYGQAGLGGVHIIPIYAAKGFEERSIPFLSPPWVDMLSATIRCAAAADMNVDMSTGTGWPFGGPMVDKEHAARKATLESYTLAAGQSLKNPLKVRGGQVRALTAYGPAGETLDLTDKVDHAGKLNWKPPAGTWTLYALGEGPCGMQVKRAAPGGEGNVLDYHSRAALDKYLAAFDKALANLPQGRMVRVFYNDSYEISSANWTGELFERFEKRRGYDLKRHLRELSGAGEADRVRRVLCDYRETMSDLMLTEFTIPWTAWAHKKGAITRNEAHGSPGNLLDLYAAADVPETEIFGTEWLGMVGLAPLPGEYPHSGGGDVLTCKLASSAAHVAGKPLTACESCTWLGEHFKVPLEHIKGEVDLLLTMGINHVFFHGCAYSPADVPWPGWQFYASIHYAPTNTIWRDVPALNRYIARCQSLLQAGKPDNDVLLYFPIYDLWNSGQKFTLPMLTVHGNWFSENLGPCHTIGQRLWDRGYGFDFVSDLQLEKDVRFQKGQLESRGGRYRTIVVPSCTHMPHGTLERLVSLAQAGATILFAGETPKDVPGLGDLENRRQRFRAALAKIGTFEPLAGGAAHASVGAGRFLKGADLDTLLELAGANRETIVDQGVKFIRRVNEDAAGKAWTYFLANFNRDKAVEGWVTLSVPANSAQLLDPMTGRAGGIPVKRQPPDKAKIYLQLAPGQTILVRAFAGKAGGESWTYAAPAGPAVELPGDWQVEFLDGGPTLPKKTVRKELSSWTTWPDEAEALKAFSGTARYTLAFDKPAGPVESWALDLGTVSHSAKVRLNGQEVGTVLARPWRLDLPAFREGKNTLEIEVTNLAANRIADLDRRKVAWRNFFFVNIHYKPFDASTWEPLPSGLLGPVRLVPLKPLELPAK